MYMSEAKGLEYWISTLTRADLPVLRQTARDLAALRADDKRLNAHSVAEVIARDPIMTVKLLRYLQTHKSRAQTTEVIQVHQALLMLGLEPVFNNVAPQPLIEEMFKMHIMALAPMLRVIHRSHRASEFAKDWALQLHDLHFEEVRVATLLYDIAEILMWCFAPDRMLEINAIQEKDKTLRSRHAQEQVLGFALIELQKELAVQWRLPELLLKLMNDSGTKQPRVRNVELAVNLARHSANGWDDTALPDDYRDISELLRVPVAQVMVMVNTDADAARDVSTPH